MMTTAVEGSDTKLLNSPVRSSLTEVVPHLADSPNLRHLTIAILTLCICLATLAVILRMWTKFFIIRQTTLDDCISSSLAESKYSDTDKSQTSFF